MLTNRDSSPTYSAENFPDAKSEINGAYRLEIELLPPVIDPAGPFCSNEPNFILTAIPPGGTWSGTGIVNPATGEFSPSVAGPGSHLITYTDPTMATATITIVVYPAPIISFISGDGTDCYGGSNGNTIITVTGGTQIPGPGWCHYLFDWDWDGTSENDNYPSNCSGGIDLEDLNNLPAGIYTVTVTDAQGCTATGSAIVDEPNQDVNPLADDVMLPCYGEIGGVIDLETTGGTPPYIYDWDWDGTGANDDFGGNPSNTDDAQDPTIIGVGVYSVTVTDFLGCTAILDVLVSQPEELEASATTEPVLCTGGASGSITLVVMGGTPVYLFDWDYDGTGDNDDPQNPAGLPAGTYSVTVTDDNGCTATTSVEVDEPLASVSAAATNTDVTCFGDNNGSINLTPSGGTGAFTYDWDNDGVGDNNDPQDLSNLSPGTYSVTVTDANGCTATLSVTINEPPEITGIFTATICAGGSITVNGTVYNESNTSGSEVFTASSGCDSTVTVSITFDPPLTGENTYQGCTGDGYSVVVNGTLYNESNPGGTETVTTPEGCDSIVTISLQFSGPVFGDETYSGCEGDGYSVVVGGATYNESNPTGIEILTSSIGCDSIVTISLTFDLTSMSSLTYQGCQGDGFTVVINGTTYDENNPSGTETITNQAGCDSIVSINFTFEANATGSVTYQGCQGDGYSVVVNGNIYNESNPSGTEVLSNSVGCDSVVTISLTFLPGLTGTESYLGCEGDGYSVTVNGNVYNESNPIGTEVLIGSNGCDSIVTINLIFSNALTGEENYSGCSGDGYQVIVGVTIFNESNPNGVMTLTSVGGCDSIVTISLIFYQNTTFLLSYEGCEGDGFQVIINGITYNENNPAGTEVIPNQAGCDSTININLNFEANSTGNVTYEGCQGDGYFTIVNGNIYNESNPIGIEILPNAFGCDSVVTIDLTYYSPSSSLVTYNGCVDDGYSVIVNGTVYDESNPTGTEILMGENGCDSIVTIELNFSLVIITILDPTLCEGGFIIVNGNVYDEDNPSGTETFIAIGGCDSLVVIDLTFDPPLTGIFEYQGCIGNGFFIVVNGVIYDEENPDGVETIQTQEGCDSIVTIDLEFLPELIGTYQADICQGGFDVVNGTVYDEDNPSGVEVFTSMDGCDSIVTVTLDFLPILEGTETYQGCTGDGYSVIVNGNTYNENNPSGVEVFQTGEGCDTMVTITLTFSSSAVVDLDSTLCHGDFLVINGTTYDQNNPSGIEWIPGQGTCDTLLNIQLAFFVSDSTLLSYVGCQGDGYEVTVNGTMYNETNPSGIESVVGTDSCDSIISVFLTFQFCCMSDTVSSNWTICEGDMVHFHGMDLDTSGSYIAIVPDAIGTGCDSVYILQLTVSNIILQQYYDDICFGESYSFGGQMYDQSGVYADTIVGGAAFGCDSVAQLILSVNPIPQADAGGDQHISCASPSVMLNGLAQGGNVLWSGADIDPSNQNLLNPVVSKPGAYVLTVESTQGCTATDVVEVTIDQNVPVANAGPDLSISCKLRSIHLQPILIDQNLLIQWQGPGINAGNQHLINPEVSTQGLYVLHLMDTIIMCTAIPDTVMVTDISNIVFAVVEEPEAKSCILQTIELNGTASTSGSNIVYIWMDSLGNYISDTTVISVVDVGSFMLMVIDTLTGCSDSTTVTVIDGERYPYLIGGADQVLNCLIQTVQVDAMMEGPSDQVEFLWTGPQGGIQSDPIQLQIWVDMPGWYYLAAIDTVNGCMSMDSVHVDDQSEIPSAMAIVDNQINCHQATAQLHAESSTSGEMLLEIWYDSNGNIIDTSDMIQVDNSGIYYLEVHDLINGCVGMDTVNVLKTDSPDAVVEITDENCAGDLQGSILIAEIFGGIAPFTYLLDGIMVQASPFFENVTPGIHSIQVIDHEGCIWQQEVMVSEGFTLSVDIGPDIRLQPGEILQLETVLNIPLTLVDSLVWEPKVILSCQSCPNPIVTGLFSTSISVTVYAEGCIDSDFLELLVNPDYEVFIPNVFSPNYDGINDYFTVYGGNSLKRIQELKIFDRWGDQILELNNFEPNIPEKGWDGTYYQRPLNPGVFVYQVVLEFIDGNFRTYSGDFTLLR